MAVARSTQRIQLGKESMPGTAVAATQLWRGNGQYSDKRVVKQVPENVGILVPTNRTYVGQLAAEFDFDNTPATFELLPYLLEAGIKQVWTGVADGTGQGKIYDYPMPTGATANTINTFTLEGGDAAGAEEVEYAFLSELKLTGAEGEPVMVSGKWIGRQCTPTTYTGSIAVPTIEHILFLLGKLYIDDSGGTIGTTLKSNTFKSFSFDLKTGLIPVYTGDGNLYFPFHTFRDPSFTLDVTFLHDAVPIAAKTKWRAETAQLVRLLFEGSAITKGSGQYEKKTLKIDLAGKWSTFDKIGEKDGIDILAGKLVGGLDSGASLFADLTVVNLLTALT